MKRFALIRHAILVSFLLIIPVQYGHSAYIQEKKLLIVGDSLSAGYGINVDNGWVNLLRQQLKKNKHNITVINASISGDTSQSAKLRLATYLGMENIHYLIIEIGGNDGLRGLPLKNFKQNIQAMIDLAHKHNVRVLLFGMKIPPNYGPFYSQAFEKTYHDLSKKNKLLLVPFFLKNIAEDPNKMQADGIHPKEQYQQQMLNNAWDKIKQLIR